MFTKKFARTFGLLMLGTGLFALVPGLSLYDQPLPNLNIESSYGSFLGIFPMNMVNKLVLMLMGIIGVSCGNAISSSFLVQERSEDAGDVRHGGRGQELGQTGADKRYVDILFLYHFQRLLCGRNAGNDSYLTLIFQCCTNHVSDQSTFVD